MHQPERALPGTTRTTWRCAASWEKKAICVETTAYAGASRMSHHESWSSTIVVTMAASATRLAAPEEEVVGGSRLKQPSRPDLPGKLGVPARPAHRTGGCHNDSRLLADGAAGVWVAFLRGYS